MKKYTAQNVMTATFPNIGYNARHEIMSNVIIEIARHQYLCIGRCGDKVGYRFMITDKNGKHIYSKQNIINFCNHKAINNAGIYDPTPNNILIVAVIEALDDRGTTSRKFVNNLQLDEAACDKLAWHIALWVKLNIKNQNTGAQFKTIDKALFESCNGNYNLYYDEKEGAKQMLNLALYGGYNSFESCGTRFTVEPLKPLHPAKWYQNKATQKSIKF